jgi:diguanylate cyclase (GGDEF)-like protein/PAS domain S-box-containing protein
MANHDPTKPNGRPQNAGSEKPSNGLYDVYRQQVERLQQMLELRNRDLKQLRQNLEKESEERQNSEQSLRESQRQFLQSIHREEDLRHTLGVLREVLRVAGNAVNQNLVLDLFLEKLVNLVPCQYASVLLVQHNDLVVAAGWDEKNLSLAAQRIPIERYSLHTQTLWEKRPVLITDLTRYSSLQLPEDIRSLRSFISAPMLISDQAIGLLGVGRTDDIPYDEDDTAALFDFATLLALALKNIFNTAQAVLGAKDVKTIVDELDSAFHKLLGADHSSLYLVDHTRREVVLHSWDGIVDTIFDYAQLDAGISGIVFRTKQPVLSLNADDGIEPEATRQGRKDFGTGAVIVVPLLFRGEVIGTYTAANLVGHREFNQRDVDILMALSAQAAIAIENVRLLEQTRSISSRLQAIIESAVIGIAVLDLDQHIVQCNPALQTMLQLPAQEIIGRHLREFSHPEDVSTGYALFQDLAAGQHEFYQVEERYLRRDESAIWGSLTVSLLRNSEGNPEFAVALIEDVTIRKQTQEKLKYLSFHDALTGLYNRLYIEVEMERLQNSRQYPISAIAADVDGLKLVNDTLGHPTGDVLIQRAGQVLRKSFRNEDIIARIGGDEFLILLPETSHDAARSILERLQKNIQQNNQDIGETLLSLSLGLATATKSGTLNQTISEADNQMYAEKRRKSIPREDAHL